MSVVSIRNPTELLLIPHSELPMKWREMWWFLKPAVDRAGDMNERLVVEKIAAGQLHPFMVYHEGQPIGALTVSISDTVYRRVATIVHLGGNFERMAPMFDDLKAWARAHGAEAFRIWGRKGWRKAAEPLGFKEKFVVMEAQI